MLLGLPGFRISKYPFESLQSSTSLIIVAGGISISIPWRRRGFACVLSLALAGCGGSPSVSLSQKLSDIRESGELVVLTTESPTTWFGSTHDPEGYEVELVEAVATDLGVNVRYVVHDDLSSVLGAITRGEGHVAAAGITQTEARAQRFNFGPAYMNVRQEVVCRMGATQITDMSDLGEADLAVLAGSSYAETLETLALMFPDLRWETVEAPSALPLLERIHAGDLDCTIADSNLVAHARLRYPELVSMFDLTEDQPLAWALPRPLEDDDGSFSDWLVAWFAEAHESGFMADLDERWYGHIDTFDYVETAVFLRRLNNRLPDYEHHFLEAADDTHFDWSLLAAQAYQESHWDPDAVSPTGVRGMMMLTRPTAQEVGVEDRTDAEQSIRGGAAYLANLYERLPDDVTGDDRLYMALAAYNIGMGHLYDARRLADRLGRDKNDWNDMREVLPLLSQREHYETLRYGYARGHEPVHYVRNIRTFQALLEANYSL